MIYVVGDSSKRFRTLDPIRKKFLVDEPHRGDNIDQYNPYFCELTGLYHMWKHDTSDIVGLEHYRRYLSLDGKNPISGHDIIRLLGSADLLCVRVDYHSRPIRSYFINNDFYSWMLKYIVFLELFAGKAYANHCLNFMDGHWHLLGNMFIARREFMDEYCRLLFPSLIGFMKAEQAAGRPIRKRVMGYLSEFLFGAYVTYFHKKPGIVQFCWN